MPSILRNEKSYSDHRENWGDCQRCELADRRKSVCLLRGHIPAAVLFVGEAPGSSEDVLGRPFVGPAGHLLSRMLKRAGLPEEIAAFTNLLACIPKDEDNKKVHNPSQFPEALKRCSVRLKSVTNLVKPSLIVWVGKEAEEYGPKTLSSYIKDKSVHTVAILHPAYILRLDVSQQGLAFQRNVIALRDALDEL